MDRTDDGTTRLYFAPRVDLVAVLKGAMATVIALPLLDSLGLRSAWALAVGCAVIEIEKRNHARGRGVPPPADPPRRSPTTASTCWPW